jgi:hypothetical protein
VLVVAACFTVVFHEDPPRIVSPYPWNGQPLAPPGTTSNRSHAGNDGIVIIPNPKKDVADKDVADKVAADKVAADKVRADGINRIFKQRFAVSWPNSLKVAVPEVVVVRIAANDYEYLLSGIRGQGRTTRTENLRGPAKVEVLLNSDPDVALTAQHSNQQVVIQGKRHREWSWGVLAKTTGHHQLSLLVRGVNGNEYEDEDPETIEYDVSFNLWYWFQNGLQQNGINWLWAVILLIATNVITYFISRRNKTSVAATPNPEPPKTDTPESPSVED